MKKHGICENHVREIAKSCEISVLGFKGSQPMARRLLQSPLDRIVVEAYRLDRYDNVVVHLQAAAYSRCRSLSFG